jgi:hypothetical protein
MAVLPDSDRVFVWARMMRETAVPPSGVLTKADLRAAVDGLDTFLDANAASINSAIPQPARAELTTEQKARLLALIVLRRWGG